MKKAILILFLLLFKLSSIVASCPMCKAAVESNLENGGKDAVGLGLNSGILYLMAIPYLMVITIGVLWYRAKKKQERNAPRYT
jgi:hypothetical protein